MTRGLGLGCWKEKAKRAKRSPGQPRAAVPTWSLLFAQLVDNHYFLNTSADTKNKRNPQLSITPYDSTIEVIAVNADCPFLDFSRRFGIGRSEAGITKQLVNSDKQ
jgi:hypothetical protein